MLKKHYTVEFIDNEGETDIKHIMATDDEITLLIDGMAKLGIIVKAYRIEPPVPESSGLLN